MADSIAAAPLPASRAQGFLEKFLDRRRRRRAYLRTVEHLSRMSDHELDDIGLTRWDIRAAARRVAGYA